MDRAGVWNGVVVVACGADPGGTTDFDLLVVGGPNASKSDTNWNSAGGGAWATGGADADAGSEVDGFSSGTTRMCSGCTSGAGGEGDETVAAGATVSCWAGGDDGTRGFIECCGGGDWVDWDSS